MSCYTAFLLPSWLHFLAHESILSFIEFELSESWTYFMNSGIEDAHSKSIMFAYSTNLEVPCVRITLRRNLLWQYLFWRLDLTLHILHINSKTKFTIKETWLRGLNVFFVTTKLLTANVVKHYIVFLQSSQKLLVLSETMWSAFFSRYFLSLQFWHLLFFALVL